MPAACSRRTATRISLRDPSDKIARLDGEKADRVVAPVVLQASLDQSAILHEGVDRQQLDRGDAERLADSR